MSEKELRPCPFCGSEVQDDPHTGENYPRKSPMGGWIIHCECCGASLSQFRKSGKGEISWNTRPIEDDLRKRIAELEEFKMIVEGCGFEVITEPPVLNHPERKILKGHGTIYVPELPELPEVQK